MIKARNPDQMNSSLFKFDGYFHFTFVVGINSIVGLSCGKLSKDDRLPPVEIKFNSLWGEGGQGSWIFHLRLKGQLVKLIFYLKIVLIRLLFYLIPVLRIGSFDIFREHKFQEDRINHKSIWEIYLGKISFIWHYSCLYIVFKKQFW